MRITRLVALFLALAGAPFGAGAPSAHAGEADWIVYIGTYSRGGSEGIYRLRMDGKSGELTRLGVTGGVRNPSFLALDPAGEHLYAVEEVSDYEGERSGSVSAFAIDATDGSLRFLNRQASRGGAPCHLVVDAKGKNVLVANYVGGNVAVLPIGPDGALKPAATVVQHEGKSVNPRRQNAPHAHSIHLDPSNRFAVAADLGLDKVLVYRFDAEAGTLLPAAQPFVRLKPGAGPRHFAFHPSGKHAYVINELHSTITAFEYEAASGELDAVQTISTLPESHEGGNSTAEVQVHPGGRFVYGSNRGHDSIAVFRVDGETGKLTAVEHESAGGRTPRNFGIRPDGRFLLAATQGTGRVLVLGVDPETGALEPGEHDVEIPQPVCVKFLRLEP